MSDTQFSKAAMLIRQQRYNDARTVLLTIDDPKSLDWLARIEALERRRRLKRRRQWRNLAIALGIVVVFFLVSALQLSERIRILNLCYLEVGYDQASIDACLMEHGIEPVSTSQALQSP